MSLNNISFVIQFSKAVCTMYYIDVHIFLPTVINVIVKQGLGIRLY